MTHNLTDEHCKCLNRVLQSAPNAIELAKAAIECGWPFESFLQALQEQQAMAQEAKQRFFPGQP